MRAIAITPGQRDLRIIERPEPAIRSDLDVKMRIVRVGICGTDREEAAGGRARAPDGYGDLVIGHEMLGVTTAVLDVLFGPTGQFGAIVGYEFERSPCG